MYHQWLVDHQSVVSFKHIFTPTYTAYVTNNMCQYSQHIGFYKIIEESSKTLSVIISVSTSLSSLLAVPSLSQSHHQCVPAGVVASLVN